MQNEADQIADQIQAVWGGLMTAMTQQGASRIDIARVSLATAHAVLELTANSLWPDDVPIPAQESTLAEAYTEALERVFQAHIGAGPTPGVV